MKKLKKEEKKPFIQCCILGAIGCGLMAAGDWLLGCVPLQKTDTGLFNRACYLSGSYLGPHIGVEAALAAVTAYQDDMLPAILPMYVPMLLVFGIHFVMLLAGKTRYPRWMLAFHPVTWNLLLAAVPDIAQAMQMPVATWMSVMSQSSTNSAIMIWCIAAAVYERSHTQ